MTVNSGEARETVFLYQCISVLIKRCCSMTVSLMTPRTDVPLVYFPVRFCLSVSVKSLAVKTASEMTWIVSGETY